VPTARTRRLSNKIIGSVGPGRATVNSAGCRATSAAAGLPTSLSIAGRQRERSRLGRYDRRPSAASQSPGRSNRPISRGGDRAGSGCGHSLGMPRWERILRTTARSSMVARKRSRPPHSGQARMSISNVRLRRSAHEVYGRGSERDEPGPSDWPAGPVGPTFAEPRAASALRIRNQCSWACAAHPRRMKIV